MVKKLVVLAGPDEGRTFVLGAEVLMLGRSRATETPLIDPHVSRIHCQVVQEENKHVVVDYDSVSGTFVNGKEVTRHVLRDGDLIRIGGTHLQYVDDPKLVVPSATTTAPPPAQAAVPTGAAPSGGAPPGATPPAQPSPAATTKVHVKTTMDWSKALIGQTLAHYHISTTLARGKSGYLFHARDTRNDTPVVLKILNPDFGQDDKKVQHFVEVMKALLPLSHPHLLKIFGAGKTGTYCWIAMEYSPSDSLSAVIGRIEKTGNIDWKVVVRVGVYVARALEYAHQKNLIHKNVTPQNILVGRKPENTKLTDVMLASATDEDPTKAMNSAGIPSESLPFMSPERTDGPSAPIDGRTDVYSLGATLYAMLTGRPPFTGKTVEELIERIRLEEAPRLHVKNVQAPEVLEKLIRVCLAKRPQDRYATSADLRKDLERIAQSNHIPL